MNTLPTLSFLFLTLFGLAHAATFDIRNTALTTVWAAASPGGGRRLNNGETWQISAAPGTTQARIWLEPTANSMLPATASARPDFIDISKIDGFNVPMEFSSNSPGAAGFPEVANGPCPGFKTEEYCCNSGNCGPTPLSCFSRRGALMLTATQRMTKRACSLAPLNMINSIWDGFKLCLQSRN
ncbi:hypothetical protein GQ457_03G020780 [Hibiscus cannabinus]